MDISKEIKMVDDGWTDKLDDCDVNYEDLKYVLHSIDNKFIDMDRELEEAGIGGIGYSSKANVINETFEKMTVIRDFIRKLPEYMSDIDKDFCKRLQNGPVYQLSQIKLEDFETRKVGGLKTSYTDHGNTYNTDTYSFKFEDFIGIIGNENEYEEDYAPSSGKINDSFVREFAEMYKQQYEEGKNSENFKSLYQYLNGEMTAGEFVQKRQHNAAINILGKIADFTPIGPIYEMITGKDAITGDELTFEEKRDATLFSGLMVETLPFSAASLATKYLDGALVDVDKGIASATTKELNKEALKFTDDYTSRMIKYIKEEEIKKLAEKEAIKNGQKMGKAINKIVDSTDGFDDDIINIGSDSITDHVRTVDLDDDLKVVDDLNQTNLDTVDDVVDDVIEGGLKTKLDYVTSNGLKLEATPGKTTTVLGSFNSDTGAIIDELGNVKSLDFGPRDGGFNLLNTPDELYISSNQFWNEYNKPWLDNVVQRNDIIKIATEPTYSNLYRVNNVTGEVELTGFGREFMYLKEECNYIYDSVTKTMIPPK